MEFNFDVESLAIKDEKFGPSLNKLFGDYATEVDACAALDSYLDKCSMFKVYKEVDGFFLQPRPNTGEGEVRIDRILVPLSKAKDAGWDGGIIGIEVKKSGGTIGPAITQAMDYSRCAFKMTCNNLIVLTWCFVFPMQNPMQACESVMTNHRIGQCYENKFQKKLRFTVGSFVAAEIDQNGSVQTLKTPLYGNKRGSRSPKK